MPKGFIHKAFGCWYKRETQYHDLHLLMLKQTKSDFTFKVSGVTPHLSFFVSNKTIVVIAYLKGVAWDILTEFDLVERRTPSGEYYCDLCLPEYKKLYGTRNELWEKHSFEPLFDWMHENLIPSNTLCFFKYGEATWAKIVNGKDHMTACLSRNLVYTVQVRPKKN